MVARSAGSGEGIALVASNQLQLLGPEVTELAERRQAKAAPLSLVELGRWAKARLPAITRVTGVPHNSEMFVLLQAVKLSEEVGELQAEVLGRLKMQRANKMQEFDQSSLAAEVADVVMTAAVLSAALSVDLPSAIQEKMAAVERKMADATARQSR